jgi:hypothetical protein
MRRRTVEDRYRANVRKQQRELENFVKHEEEWADHLMTLYKYRKQEVPDDEYRAVAFIKNKEYLKKRGALTLLYQMYNRCWNEMPQFTKEQAFDYLRFRFKMYAAVLTKGGFD